MRLGNVMTITADKEELIVGLFHSNSMVNGDCA